MINIKYNKNNAEIIIQSSLMASIMLITGCSTEKTIGSTELPVNSNQTVIESDDIVETTVIGTPTPVVYNFVWDDVASESFLNYFQQRFYGKELPRYLGAYGFDKNVNAALTDFINLTYNTSYESVPFSEVNYFQSYHLSEIEKYHYYNDNYEGFSKMVLNPNDCENSIFNSRLVMSYLIENEIPFGTRIPVESFVSIMGADTYTFDTFDYYCNHMSIGNDISYAYSKEDLFLVLSKYNSGLTRLCKDQRIYDYDLFSTNPDLKDSCDEARIMYQSYLDEFYGDNGPQLGVVPTMETYNTMFPGEELINLSNIQGSIYDPNTQEIVALPPDIDYSSVSNIDEALLGEWTGYLDAAGFTYIYEFYDDSTGTYTSIHETSDLQSSGGSQQTNVVEFTYTPRFGILTIEFSNGNTVNYSYKIVDGTLVMNDVSYDHTSSVRSR